MPKTNEEWKQRLTPEQYEILREKGTEAPFAGKYVNHHENGMYACAACGTPLFDSGTKFNSGTGWPSFSDVAVKRNVTLAEDTNHSMVRTEVLCKTCGGHLGHLFDDGPTPTGKRYCINSACLNFKPKTA